MYEINNLFESFSPISKSEWLDKLNKDLKGKPLETLDWHISENLIVAPFYHPDDAINSVVLPNVKSQNSWLIEEQFFIPAQDLKTTNKQVLHALEQGVQVVCFVMKEAPDTEDWAILLEGVQLDFVHTRLCCKSATEACKAGMSWAAYAKMKGFDLKALRGGIHTFFGKTTGALVMNDYYKVLRHELPSFQLFDIDGIAQCLGDEHTVEELVHLIAKGNKVLAFYEKSTPLTDLASRITFSVGIGKSYFIQIAKLRALKILWANVLEAYGVVNKTTHIHAHIAPQTLGDNVNTNMIQTTTQAMAAIIGGCDSLHVLPANANTEMPTDFTRRIARNVQHILQMESHFGRVTDPAAGSYYIEKLSQELAIPAWNKFLKERL